MKPYLYGLHEPGGEDIMPPGSWIVFTHELGHDPLVKTGFDYTPWTTKGYRILARLNNGYHPNGTIPLPEFYDAFATRVANFIKASQGCTRFIIGNEPNHSQERPQSRPITADDYARCFAKITGRITDVDLIPAAVAPWNVETGDWLEYFQEVLTKCPGIGGICLHAYTHGSDPNLITSTQLMDPPFEDRFYHFRAYVDLVHWIPLHLSELPIYITETNQDQSWLDENNGWVQEAYKEINDWDQLLPREELSIHALCLYRWPRYDDKYIEGKQGVIDDFKAAISHGYSLETEKPPMENLLTNPSFEPPFEEWKDENGVPQGPVKVAQGWQPYWLDVRPEYKAATQQFPGRVLDGQTAQQFFKNYDTPNGGLYQVVENVEPGRRMRAAGHVQVWTSSEDNPDQSNGRCWSDIGVDPYGGTDPEGPDIIWSEAVRAYDVYDLVNIEFESKSDRVTVFIRSIFEWKFKNNNTYWDKMELTYTDDLPPIESPPPGSGDLQEFYRTKVEEMDILSTTYAEIAEIYRDLLNGS